MPAKRSYGLGAMPYGSRLRKTAETSGWGFETLENGGLIAVIRMAARDRKGVIRREG